VNGRRIVLALGLGLLAACAVPRHLEMPYLAHAQVAPDFDTYELRRVGLLPFGGAELGAGMAEALQLSFFSEVSQAAPYEVVLLEEPDLEEVERSEPYRRGWYKPRTIIAISRRYNLDGLLFGTVTQQRTYPPQILSLQVDLVSAETGLAIWSSTVHLDAADQRVRDGLQLYYQGARGDENAPEWTVALLSPERFARFAAFQVACLL